MELPHGAENRAKRIDLRAEALVRGVHWALECDITDINHGEEVEIAEAKKLAKCVDRGRHMAVKPACPSCGEPIPAATIAAAVKAARSAEGRKIFERNRKAGTMGGRPRKADRCDCGKWTRHSAMIKRHKCEETTK